MLHYFLCNSWAYGLSVSASVQFSTFIYTLHSTFLYKRPSIAQLYRAYYTRATRVLPHKEINTPLLCHASPPSYMFQQDGLQLPHPGMEMCNGPSRSSGLSVARLESLKHYFLIWNTYPMVQNRVHKRSQKFLLHSQRHEYAVYIHLHERFYIRLHKKVFNRQSITISPLVPIVQDSAGGRSVSRPSSTFLGTQTTIVHILHI